MSADSGEPAAGLSTTGGAWAPTPDEVAPGIFRLPIPLPDSPLGTVNVYCILGDGIRLVDCGWNTPEAYDALVAGLAAVGSHVRDIREIVVTHIHPDHFGLAGRLAEESGARVLMHRLEAQIVAARYQDTRSLVEEMEAWLRIHGVPRDDLVSMAEGSLMLLRRVGTRRPDDVLDGGETLAWESSFELMWTPGHSAGLICLYDREAETFISSDHVLERISPHVGLHAQSFGNPLADYLDSLRLVRDLPVRLVLPGHGSPFADLRGRVDELVAHHEHRFARIREELAGAERSAFEVAGRLSWRGSERGWDRLAPFQRRMAVTETIAHLENMHTRGQIGKEIRKGAILYSSPGPS